MPTNALALVWFVLNFNVFAGSSNATRQATPTSVVDLRPFLSEVSTMAVSPETGTVAVVGSGRGNEREEIVALVGSRGQIRTRSVGANIEFLYRAEFVDAGRSLACVGCCGDSVAGVPAGNYWLKVWNLEDRSRLLTTSASPVFAVSSAGSVFLTVTNLNVLRLVDIKTKEEIDRPLDVDDSDVDAYLGGLVRSAALSRQGELVALGSTASVRVLKRGDQDYHVRLVHEPDDAQALARKYRPWFEDPNAQSEPVLARWYQPVTILRFSPDGNLLLSVRNREARLMGYGAAAEFPNPVEGEGSDISIWETKGWRQVRKVRLSEELADVCFSPDSRTLACVGLRGRGFLVDLGSSAEIAALAGKTVSAAFLKSTRAVFLRSDLALEFMDFRHK